MNRVWILGAGVAALVAGVYALNAQVVPQPGPPVAIACAFNTVPPTLTTGQAGWVQCDNAGKLITSSGGGGGDVNVTEWASVLLGAPSNFGTTPGAVTVPGVNAAVISSALPTGAATAANQSTIITSLSTLNTNVTSPIPTQAPTVDIGAVGISQTTPGTSNKVAVGALPRAARNAPGCTVGTSSAQCLAANTAVTFLQLQNTNSTSTNYVACNIVGGTAVLNSATSVQLAPGQSASWGPNTGGVPSGAINCIATSASSPLYVEWN